MTEFFNSKVGQKKLARAEKNPISKSKTNLSTLEKVSFPLRADFRGKEMKIEFVGSGLPCMLLNFAKIGSLRYFEDFSKIDKETLNTCQLRLLMEDGSAFCVVDRTRFSTWSWNPDFRTDRSPDIVTEHNAWRKHMYSVREHDAFDKAVFELMLNVKFFNGIGNVTRSEILARTRFSPFTSYREVLESEVLREDFFQTCKETLEEVYSAGGLQLSEWENPFGVGKEKLGSLLRVYQNREKAYVFKDKLGRNLWFDKRWALEYAIWANRQDDLTDTKLLDRIYSIERSKQKRR